MSIKSAHDELVSVIRWIDGHSNELDIEGDVRSQVAAACFDTVLEHQAAIAALVQLELHGSALALLRVIAEALFRGMWFARCATDDELSQFQNDQLDKPLKQLVQEIETALGNQNDVLSAIVRKQWKHLCSFTHTGFKQITRRYSGSILKPNYPEGEVVQSLRFAGAIGLIAVIELAALSKNNALGMAALERSRQFAAS